jgi:hypothetical protein
MQVDDEAGQPAFDLVKWNEFDLKVTTFRSEPAFFGTMPPLLRMPRVSSRSQSNPHPKIRDDRLNFEGFKKPTGP